MKNEFLKKVFVLNISLLLFIVASSTSLSSLFDENIGYEPNDRDEVTYDVYFGVTSPPPKVVSNQTETTFNPGSLAHNTIYYWQIVAWNDQGDRAEGPIWHFTTSINQPPVAVAIVPSIADKKVPVVFDGSESYDPDGFIVNWSWDFGDSSQGFGEVVEHSYMDSGEYPVVLVVEDDDGATDDDVISISIINHAPVAIISGPSYGYVGEPLTFDGSASYDPDGDSLTYEWEFSDGTPNEYDMIVEHIFTSPGTYLVLLTVEDDDINDPRTDTDTLLVEIIEPNMPPVADAGPDQTVSIFDVVTFDGSGSYDYDGEIVNWTWDFGTSEVGYGEIVEYMYYYDGEFLVTLIVEDDDGATDNDTCIVTVLGPLSEVTFQEKIRLLKLQSSTVAFEAVKITSENSPPPRIPGNPFPEDGATDVSTDVILSWTGGLDNPPEAPTIDGPTDGIIGEEYDYVFNATDPDEDQIYYWIEWGDDTNTGWIGLFDSGVEIIESHTWDKQGTYTISAKVKDTYDVESEWGYLDIEMPIAQELIISCQSYKI